MGLVNGGFVVKFLCIFWVLTLWVWPMIGGFDGVSGFGQLLVGSVV